MGNRVASLKRVVSVTVDKKTLEEIADLLGIRRKADRASIINDGIVITPGTPAAGSTPRTARTTTTRSSTASSTASRAKRPRK